MDRKSTGILIMCVALFALWAYLTPKLYPPPPPPSRTNVVASTTNQAQPSTNVAAPALATTNQVVSVMPPPGAPEETLIVTNGPAYYHFTSQGGGLKFVEFDQQKYPESIPSFAERRQAKRRPASLNHHSPQPVLALLNAGAIQGDGAYKLSRATMVLPPSTNAPAVPARTADVVRAEKQLANQVYIVKDFELAPDYLIRFRARIENRSTQALELPPLEWSAGAATPENRLDKGDSVGFAWHNTKVTKIDKMWFENRTLGCIPGTPRSEYRATNTTATWVALYNQFFFMSLLAKDKASEVFGTQFHLPHPSREELAENRLTVTNQIGLRVSLIQPATNLAAGAILEREFLLFAGPKEMRVVERVASQFGGDLDSYMLYPGIWSMFEVFARVLLLSMNGLHALGLSYALAIISITVILKILFWPLTQASTRSMKRMQALAPQMKAMQEKYKEEPDKLQKKMWEFYREHKVNPMSGCLPMLVQIPVFIGFFTMVRSAIELRGAAFLWATDLSRPDTLFIIPGLGFLPFIGVSGVGLPINPLSLLMGVTMLFQARMAPAAPGMDPTAQKMMRYMPLFFLIILYNYSAGLTLYWTVQNLLTIVQTKLTKAKEEPASQPPARPTSPARPAAAASPALRRRK